MLLGEGSGGAKGKRDGVSVAEKSGVLSDFSRRTFVEGGVVRRNSSEGRPSGRSDRAWTVSSLKQCRITRSSLSQVEVCVLVFEKGSELSAIAHWAFNGSALSSIVIPSSVVVLESESFECCRSLHFVLFENGSRL
jgi:hypothetical protein